MLDWMMRVRVIIIIKTNMKMEILTFKKHIDASKIISFALDEADVMIGQQGYQDKSIRIHKSHYFVLVLLK